MLRLAVCLLAFFWAPVAAAEEKRLALILTNEDYPASVGKLTGTHEDGERIEKALIKVGFAVKLVPDANSDETHAALTDFEIAIAEEAADGDDVVVFFYASMHGAAATVDEELTNFLIPAKEEVRTTGELIRKGIQIEQVVKGLSASGASAVFVISDACRNELATTFTKSLQKGFNRVEASKGMIVAFATAAGATTPDDGIFSTVLAEEIEETGRRASYAIYETVERVAQLRPFKGQPWMTTGGIPESVCFNGCTSNAPASENVTELMTVFQSLNPDEVRAFLAKYPNTAAKSLLSSRVEKLQSDTGFDSWADTAFINLFVDAPRFTNIVSRFMFGSIIAVPRDASNAEIAAGPAIQSHVVIETDGQGSGVISGTQDPTELDAVIGVLSGKATGSGPSGGSELMEFLASAPSERVLLQAGIGDGFAYNGTFIDCGASGAADFARAPARAMECFVQSLRQTSAFEFVERNWIFAPPEWTDTRTTASAANLAERISAPALELPDSLFWNLKGKAAGSANFSSRPAIASPAAKDRRVVVAVIDTGLKWGHVALADQLILPGYDFVSEPTMANDGDGRDADYDDAGDACERFYPGKANSLHGTQVASVMRMALEAAGQGRASSVAIVPVRAIGRCGGTLSDINDAIRWSAGIFPGSDENYYEIWTESPADIILVSATLYKSCPASLQMAINDAVARGSVVVAPAGDNRQPAAFSAPGNCQNVVTVAAGDAQGRIATYSNFGPEIDILAPGGDTFRDDNSDGHPDGLLAAAAQPCTDAARKSDPACNLTIVQGSSFAAAHVVAALALELLESKENAAAAMQAMQRLRTRPPAENACNRKCVSFPEGLPLEDQPAQCRLMCGVQLNLGAPPTP